MDGSVHIPKCQKGRYPAACLDRYHQFLSHSIDCVCKQQFCTAAILWFHLLVMELVHEYIGEIQNAEPHINWTVQIKLGLLHIYRGEIFGEKGIKGWRRY